MAGEPAEAGVKNIKNESEIVTAEDRAKWIEGLKRGKASREHIERLKLIYKPFPVVRRIGGGGSAATWAGTIVSDTFFGTGERPTGKKGDGRDMLQAGSTYNGKYADVEALI
jgi:hypothetical protein